MIKHKCWSAPKDGADGLRILATAHYARGQRRDICDVWLPELGPDRAVFQAFKRDEITWAEFLSEYRTRLQRAEQRHLLQLLAALSRNFGTNITVMCHCDDASECHRVVLANAIKRSYRALHQY